MAVVRTKRSADVFDRVLDKGIVIEGWCRIYPFGIDVGMAMESRTVVASIDTYLARGELIEFLTPSEPPAPAVQIARVIEHSVPPKVSGRVAHSRHILRGGPAADRDSLAVPSDSAVIKHTAILGDSV